MTIDIKEALKVFKQCEAMGASECDYLSKNYNLILRALDYAYCCTTKSSDELWVLKHGDTIKESLQIAADLENSQKHTKGE